MINEGKQGRVALLSLDYHRDIGHLSFAQDNEGNLLVKDRLNQTTAPLHSRLYMPPEMGCYDVEKYHMMKSILRLHGNFKSSNDLSAVIVLVLVTIIAGSVSQLSFDVVLLWLLLAIAFEEIKNFPRCCQAARMSC